MVDILLRNVDETLDKNIRIQAAQHGRTRELEIKFILESAMQKKPRKRSLCDALLDCPSLTDQHDPNDLFTRSNAPARDH